MSDTASSGAMRMASQVICVESKTSRKRPDFWRLSTANIGASPCILLPALYVGSTCCLIDNVAVY